MAFVTGTAADHIDLWDKLLDFLQNNPELVASGQQWVTEWEHATENELVLKGPGISGQDEVLIGLKRRDSALSGSESVINISGMTGIIPSATDYTGHVNVLPRRPLMFVDHQPMRYWFVANGRRFVVVVKMSTVFEAMYAGLFLPYATPSAYPYPLFIGGSRGYSGNSSTPTSWRAGETDAHTHFIYPRMGGTGDSNWLDSPACVLRPDAGWEMGTIDKGNAPGHLPTFYMGPRCFHTKYRGADISPVGTSSGGYDRKSSGPGYRNVLTRMTAGLNGELLLTPATIITVPTGAEATLGVLDGCFTVTGQGNAAENTVTMDGVTHLVVQNVQRTTPSEYWALALE